MNIAGSVAVVTGSARGIGLAIAKSLAAGGAKVVLGDILEEGLNRSVRDIRAAGGEAVAVVADVTRDADVERLMDTAVAEFGAINIVCANAGIARDGLLLSRDPDSGKVQRVLTSEEFRAVVEVNLVGPFITFREAARRMADNGWKGVLLVISSVNKAGQPGQINYSSTKAVVALWPKILAGEFHWCGIKNIRVVGIAPGYTRRFAAPCRGESPPRRGNGDKMLQRPFPDGARPGPYPHPAPAPRPRFFPAPSGAAGTLPR